MNPSVCYVVVKPYTWEKDLYLGVFVNQLDAEREADRLNKRDDTDDEDRSLRGYRVWPLPFNELLEGV